MTNLVPIDTKIRSIQGDPFAVEPPPRPFYYPTVQKELSSAQRKTALSPERPRPLERDEVKPSSSGQRFLDGGHVYYRDVEQFSGDRSSKFDESWPSSERPSTISDKPSPVSQWVDMQLRPAVPDDRVGQRSEYQPAVTNMKKDGQSDSVLSKYIDRFRHGVPQSRTEREKQQRPDQAEFWWLKNSDTSSPSPLTPTLSSMTPTSSSTPIDRRVPSMFPHASPQLTKRAVSQSPVKRITKEDILTEKLQDRAARLLELTDTSSTPPVSSQGVGSLSMTPSSFEEQPYRPAFVKYLEKEDNKQYMPKSLSKEDDILQQWRLRRKVELAREKNREQPRTSGSSLNEEVEAKLAAFRQKLAKVSSTPTPGGAEVSTPPKATQRLGFGATKSDQLQPDSKLGAFRQKLTETVTSTEFLSRGEQRMPIPSSPVHDGAHLAGSPLKKPCDSAQHLFQTPPTREYEMRVSPIHSPIASPQLKRRANQTDDVQPHFHLMCDMMPCPHQLTNQEAVIGSKSDSKGVQAESKSTHSSVDDQGLDDGGNSRVASTSRAQRNDQPMQKTQRLEQCNRQTVDGERKPLHKESKSESHIHDKISCDKKHSASGRILGDKAILLDDALSDIGRETAKPDSNSKYYDGKRLIPNRHGVSSSPQTTQVSDHMHEEESSVSLSDQDSVISAVEVGRGKHGAKHKVKSGVSKPGLLTESQGYSPQSQQVKKLPSDMSQAIEEVVRLRIFDEEDHHSDVAGQQSPVDSDAKSSEEEFSEDDLLCQLRRQRDVYEVQLRKIDSLLHELNSEW